MFVVKLFPPPQMTFQKQIIKIMQTAVTPAINAVAGFKLPLLNHCHYVKQTD